MYVAARAVEQRFNADTSDHIEPNGTVLVRPARPLRRTPHQDLHQRARPLALVRAYYHCTTCQAGFCPRDRALGLEGPALSPGVMRMVGHVGAMVSFVEGSERMRELAAVAVDAKQIERTAEALGREIAQDERSVVESEPPPAPTMYLGMDGTGLPMRASELEGREGKQPDGSAKTRDEGKIDAVLAALQVHAPANEEARKGLDYVTRNQSRMRYPEFRAQGLCVSSGVVEAGCKVAIGTRLKRAGMHWTVDRGRRNHRAALLQAQRPLRGLLGAAFSRCARRSPGCPVSSSHKSDVRPIAGYPQGVLRARGEVVIEAQSGRIRLVSIDYTRSS